MIKHITLELCVCPKCIMHGAMDLMESVNSIKKMKSIKNKYTLTISTSPCLSDCKHEEQGPVVLLNGELIEKSRENEIMSRILNIILADS